MMSALGGVSSRGKQRARPHRKLCPEREAARLFDVCAVDHVEVAVRRGHDGGGAPLLRERLDLAEEVALLRGGETYTHVHIIENRERRRQPGEPPLQRRAAAPRPRLEDRVEDRPVAAHHLHFPAADEEELFARVPLVHDRVSGKVHLPRNHHSADTQAHTSRVGGLFFSCWLRRQAPAALDPLRSAGTGGHIC